MIQFCLGSGMANGGEDMSRIQQVGQMQASNKAGAGGELNAQVSRRRLLRSVCMFIIMGEVKSYPQDHETFPQQKDLKIEGSERKSFLIFVSCHAIA